MSVLKRYLRPESPRAKRIVACSTIVLLHVLAALTISLVPWSRRWYEVIGHSVFWEVFLNAWLWFGVLGFAVGQVTLVALLAALTRAFPTVKLGLGCVFVATLVWWYTSWFYRNPPYGYYRSPSLELGGQAFFLLAITIASITIYRLRMSIKPPTLLCGGRDSALQWNIRDVLITTIIVGALLTVVRVRWDELRVINLSRDWWELGFVGIHAIVSVPIANAVGLRALCGRRFPARFALLLAGCAAESFIIWAYVQFLDIGYWNLFYYSYPASYLYGLNCGIAVFVTTSVQVFTVYFTMRALGRAGLSAVREDALESSPANG